MGNLIKTFGLILYIGINPILNAQQLETQFEIKLFKDRDCIGLMCDKGCTWTYLYIKKNNFYINQYGMMNINNKDEVNKSVFIFSVEKKGDNICLKAKKGLKWKKLCFKLPKDKTTPIIINNIDISVPK